MELKMYGLNFLVHVFVILLLKGLHSKVPDPCPNDVLSTTVAEMCTESSAVEEEPSTNDIVNSVVVRVRTQKNCSCLVFLENQSNFRQIRVRSYNGLRASFPEQSPCGLTINIGFLNQTYQQPIQPFECSQGSQTRHFDLLKNAGLQFTSSVNEGLFERGYCIQIIREPISGSFRLRLKCSGIATDNFMVTSSILATSESSITQATFDPSTSQSTTDSRNNIGSAKNHSTLYAVIGVLTAVVLLLLVVIGIILYRKTNVCKRKSDNKQHYQTTCFNNISDENNAYDTLRNNNQDGPVVTNVQQNTSEEYYNNVDLDTMQQINS